MAEVDLKKLGEQIAATVERQKENDPKELKKTIVSLQSQLRLGQFGNVEKVTKVADPKAIEKAVKLAVDKVQREYQEQAHKANRELSKMGSAMASIGKIVNQFQTTPVIHVDIKPLKLKPVESWPKPGVPGRELQAQVRETSKPLVDNFYEPKSNSNPDFTLGKGEKTILIAVAQYPEGAERDQLTVLTGYKRSSRDTYLQRLQAAGYVEQKDKGLAATDAGIQSLGSDYQPLPTGEDLQKYWIERLPEGEKRILQILIDQYPRSIDRESLSTFTEYRRSSRDTYIQRLSSRKLAEIVGKGEVKASKVLFE